MKTLVLYPDGSRKLLDLELEEPNLEPEPEPKPTELEQLRADVDFLAAMSAIEL